MSEEYTNPYSSPASDPVPVVLESPQLLLASPWTRFLSAFIDGLISTAAYFLIRLVLSALKVIPTWSVQPQEDILHTFLIGILAILAFYAIHWRFLSANGQTIGKVATNIRIATMEGGKPSMTDLAIKRYGFMNVVPLIPFGGGIISLIDVLCIFRRDRRCLHDQFAGTQVVQVRP